MDVNTIREDIKPFKENGVGALSVKEISLFLLKKVDRLETKLTEQITFCKTHIDEKKGFQKGTVQIMTILLATLAICVSVYAAFN